MQYLLRRVSEIVCAFSCATYAAASHAEEPTTSALPQVAVNITALHSGKCLTVQGASRTGGARAIQQTCAGLPSQEWRFVVMSPDQVQIVSTLSGLCLDVGGASTSDGAIVQQGTCRATATHQRWQGKDAGNGYVQLVAAHSGKCLDVPQRSTADGVETAQWACNQGDNQRWLAKPSKTAASPAIVCEKAPATTIEWTTEWREEVYGGNSMYANFFSPLTYHKGSYYFAWITATGLPQITKLTNGKAVTRPLADNYRARINPHNLFSIGIDAKGFIHVTGDMQNGPNARDTEYPARYLNASILYWVSNQPENIEAGFGFYGDTPNRIPAKRVNGIRFFTDLNGELYSSATVDAIEHGAHPGRRGIGLYRYSTTTKLWTALGGLPPKTPDSGDTAVVNPVLFWEVGGVGVNGDWQGFFSFFKFDSSNRLHFASAINTDPNLDHENLVLYAVSDDQGLNWKRADGTAIAGLPLRAAAGNPNRAHLVAEGLYNWQTTVIADANGWPAVYTSDLNNNWQDTWFTWTGSAWSAKNSLNGPASRPRTGYTAPGGSMILNGNQYSPRLYCQKTLGGGLATHEISALKNYQFFISGDDHGLRQSGALVGVGVNRTTKQQSIIKVQFQP